MQEAKVIDRGTVFRGRAATQQQSCAFPGICTFPNGRWLCTFRCAPSKSANVGQRVLVAWSDDEGKSWSEPVDPFAAPSVDGRPGAFRAGFGAALSDHDILMVLAWVDQSDPSLPFFNETTQGLLDMRVFLAWSSDRGVTWSEPGMANVPFDVPVPITGPILSLANGELACQFELNKHYYDETEWHHASVLAFSKDGGRSWPERSLASCDPENRVFYWDQRPNVLADGRVLNLFWTYDTASATYLNIHGRESLDNARTWSEMWDTGIPGQPAQPVSLPDGRVAIVYVDRTDVPVLKARTSRDGGRTWPQATEIVVYQLETESETWEKKSMQDTWAEMGAFSFGLPATTVLPNGDALVVFYAGPETDRTGIHWVRMAS